MNKVCQLLSCLSMLDQNHYPLLVVYGLFGDAFLKSGLISFSLFKQQICWGFLKILFTPKPG